MARRIDHLWEEPGDDYTPATDLIFSMFAVTVLLLALFGAGDHVKSNISGQTITLEKAKVNALESAAARFERDNAALRGEIEALRRRAASVATVAPPPGANPDAARLAEAIALAEDYRRRLEVVQAGIDFAQISVGGLAEVDVGDFLTADTISFSPAARDRLLALIAGRADDIVTLHANRLLFEISSSAERGTDHDGVDLDMMETMAWGEALMRAMRRTPLPVGCLAVMPTGKLRNVLLHDLAIGPNAGRAIDDFEKLLGLRPIPPAIARQLALARPTDRRITVWAQSIAADSCDPKVLAAAVRSLRPAR